MNTTAQEYNLIDILTLTDDVEHLPEYSSAHAAGADVRAKLQEPLLLKAGCSILVPTGLKVQIPQGFEIQVRPRSGLALKNQITVLNTPGTIDSDYRGEIGVILINHGLNDFTILPGMRIAQLIVAPVVRGRFIKVDEINESVRGVGGFGHTGTH